MSLGKERNVSTYQYTQGKGYVMPQGHPEEDSHVTVEAETGISLSGHRPHLGYQTVTLAKKVHG